MAKDDKTDMGSDKSENEKPQKRPVGRPTFYKPEYCEMLLESCRQGKSFVQFASQIGVHVDSIYEWGNQHEDFAYALKKGKTLAEAYMEELGMQNMMAPPGSWSQSVYIFFMKARFGWRDTPEQKGEQSKEISEQNEKLANVSKQLEQLIDKK